MKQTFKILALTITLVTGLSLNFPAVALSESPYENPAKKPMPPSNSNGNNKVVVETKNAAMTLAQDFNPDEAPCDIPDKCGPTYVGNPPSHVIYGPDGQPIGMTQGINKKEEPKKDPGGVIPGDPFPCRSKYGTCPGDPDIYHLFDGDHKKNPDTTPQSTAAPNTSKQTWSDPNSPIKESNVAPSPTSTITTSAASPTPTPDPGVGDIFHQVNLGGHSTTGGAISTGVTPLFPQDQPSSVPPNVPITGIKQGNPDPRPVFGNPVVKDSQPDATGKDPAQSTAASAATVAMTPQTSGSSATTVNIPHPSGPNQYGTSASFVATFQVSPSQVSMYFHDYQFNTGPSNRSYLYSYDPTTQILTISSPAVQNLTLRPGDPGYQEQLNSMITTIQGEINNGNLSPAEIAALNEALAALGAPETSFRIARGTIGGIGGGEE